MFEALKLVDDQQKPVLIRALCKEFFNMVEAYNIFTFTARFIINPSSGA